MSEPSTPSFQGMCHYIGQLSKASKVGMRAALADCPKCHFNMLEGLLHSINCHGKDGAIYVSDLAREIRQPLPAVSRGLRLMEQDGTVVGSGGHGLASGTLYYDVNSKKVYAEDMGWLYSWEEIKASTNQPFIADAVSITPKEGSGGPDDTYISATDTPVDVSEVQGKIIIMPDGTALDGVVYEDVTSASEGLFAAKMAGLWGFVNATTGQQAVPFVYEAVRPFNEGLAAVKTATGWGYINTSGAEQTVMTFENAQSASGGKAWVKTADGWGVALLSDWKA